MCVPADQKHWKDSLEDMNIYLDRMDRRFYLYDVPLVHNFSTINQPGQWDRHSQGF